MKNLKSMFLIKSCTLLALSMGAASCGNSDDGPGKNGSGETYTKETLYLADPYVLLHDGVYYAYGTSSNPDGIIGYYSNDLKSWYDIAGGAKDGYVLHKDDVWGVTAFWAPEVYHDPDHNRFVMYYTAKNTTNPDDTEPRICAAVSDSPTGPFRQDVKETMLSDKAIDNALFIDDDGEKYMYFTVPGGGGYETKVVRIQKDDITRIQPNTRKACISAIGWEKQEGAVNEGPTVIKHEGTYYLTYSGNGFESQLYGIGCATSDSPMGPWTKYDHNPLLQKPGALKGTGHNGIFHDKEGNMKIVFHAHASDTKVAPRRMFITGAHFQKVNDRNIFTIDKNYETPYLIRKVK